MFGSNRTPEQIIAMLVSFVIAITIHEFMHAWTANKLGDPTARNLGRITLNPVEHFDPIGFMGLALISLGMPFIGWGKPVPVQPGNFRGSWARKRKEGMLLVAAAGPASNVAQALIVAIPIQVMIRSNIGSSAVLELLLTFVHVNLLLAAFNMIPVPPLDGYKILTGILPSFWTPVLRPLEQYGFMILLLFVFVGNRIGGGSILAAMYSPVFNALRHVVYYGLL